MRKKKREKSEIVGKPGCADPRSKEQIRKDRTEKDKYAGWESTFHRDRYGK